MEAKCNIYNLANKKKKQKKHNIEIQLTCKELKIRRTCYFRRRINFTTTHHLNLTIKDNNLKKNIKFSKKKKCSHK